jgi:hypothetical protein
VSVRDCQRAEYVELLLSIAPRVEASRLDDICDRIERAIACLTVRPERDRRKWPASRCHTAAMS